MGYMVITEEIRVIKEEIIRLEGAINIHIIIIMIIIITIVKVPQIKRQFDSFKNPTIKDMIIKV